MVWWFRCWHNSALIHYNHGSDTAQSNMMLTQIAEQLTANRQKEDIREEGLISLNLEVAAMSVLNPTYSP